MKKVNRYFILGGICFMVTLLQNQFGVLAFMLGNNPSCFIVGMLTAIGILLEYVGLYNRNNEVTFRQRKREFFLKLYRALKK